MFSETPGSPGRRQQIPRTHRVIGVPACDARYSAWITPVSTSAFSFAKIPDGWPARASSACASIFAITVDASAAGATASLRWLAWRENPDSALNSSETSSPKSGSAVNRPMSV